MKRFAPVFAALALVLLAAPVYAQTAADARDEAIRSRGFIRAAETQLTKVIAALDSIRSDARVDTVTVTDTVIRTVVQVDSVPFEVVRWDTVTLVRVDTVFVAGPPAPEPEPGTVEVGVNGGSEAVLAICDGAACDLTWNHYEHTEGTAPPAYAVWLVDGDPASVELPVWPDGPEPVTVGGVTARPVTEGPCAYPVIPRGPAPQLHSCRVGGVPDTPGLSWMVTWAQTDVTPIAEETQAVGLSPVTDLRVTMTGSTALALEWTQVSDGRGGAADYGVRWTLPDGEWSPVVAVIGWAAGEPIGYTVPGLEPGTTVTVQVAPFRGVLPDRAVVGLPVDVTATTATP